MTCRDVIEFLMDYLNGELSADVRRVFDEHLSVCTACRNYLATYQQSIGLARDSLQEDTARSEVPSELVRAILAARSQQGDGNSSRDM